MLRSRILDSIEPLFLIINNNEVVKVKHKTMIADNALYVYSQSFIEDHILYI